MIKLIYYNNFNKKNIKSWINLNIKNYKNLISKKLPLNPKYPRLVHVDIHVNMGTV